MLANVVSNRNSNTGFVVFFPSFNRFCNFEPHALQDGSESVFDRGFSPYHQHRRIDAPDELSRNRLRCYFGRPGGSEATCTTTTGVTSAGACLIDPVLAGGTTSGYVFAVSASGTLAVTYTSLATPQVQGQTGQNAYCSDQSGVLFYNLSGTTCTNGSNPL